MIKEEKVKAVWALHKEGVNASEIGKKLSIDRKTASKIIQNEGNVLRKTRKDKIVLDDELLIKTFKKCEGWGERTHEELQKQGINIAYPTLMRTIRELGLKENNKKFSTPVPDVPGSESQHDLSPYRIKIGDTVMNVQASLLHYRYSKINYLKFYPSFNRFNMQCFFFEALNYFGYTPSQCVIDNTSLVINRGSGINAVFNQEMIDFAKSFGFKWFAHAIKHSDRKAGVERGFWTIETNFFPGREFNSMEDLNEQARSWCESRSKKMNKNKIIPIDYFEYEKDFMAKIIPHISAPYRQHNRIIDQEGYILFGTNLYWVGVQRHLEITLLEYADKIKIYYQRKIICEYNLPPFGTREKKFKPDGVTIPYRPKKHTVAPHEEEKELRAYSVLVSNYLDFSLKAHGPQNRYQFIRQVYYLYKNLSHSLFDKTIERALKYKIRNRATLEKIAIYIVSKDENVAPELEIEFSLSDANDYRDGLYGNDPDLSSYDRKWGGSNE